MPIIPALAGRAWFSLWELGDRAIGLFHLFPFPLSPLCVFEPSTSSMLRSVLPQSSTSSLQSSSLFIYLPPLPFHSSPSCLKCKELCLKLSSCPPCLNPDSLLLQGYLWPPCHLSPRKPKLLHVRLTARGPTLIVFSTFGSYPLDRFASSICPSGSNSVTATPDFLLGPSSLPVSLFSSPVPHKRRRTTPPPLWPQPCQCDKWEALCKYAVWHKY